MRTTIELLRGSSRARWFFAVLTQSSLGTGASYVALLIIAYDRFRSPWAISLILAADLLPAMLLGPLFGALADRFSRRWCLVGADLLRAAAFAGIAIVDGFVPTVCLAVLAGVGTGLFTPAGLASLPSVAGARLLPAATALYGAIADLGFALGPALAGALLIAIGPEGILVFNAATFAVSGAVLVFLRFGSAPSAAEPGVQPVGLFSQAREGVRVAARLRGVRTVLLASAAALFFAGTFNVAELLLVKDELGAGSSGFALLVGLLGLGFIGGSLAGARGGPLPELKRNYLAGLGVMGVGFLASGIAPSAATAALAFLTAGFGNGLMLVYERLLIQAKVEDSLAGRIFGVKDALSAWAFALAFAAGGALIDLLGVREAVVLAGFGAVLAWLGALVRLRGTWEAEPVGARLGVRGQPLGQRLVGEQDADVVGGRDHWLALLDDLRERGDDGGVELGPGVSG